MKKIRVIARLDIKNEFVIKGIHLEGLRKIGDPNELAVNYYKQGVDEIIFIDAVAAYYDRNSLSNIIKKACKEVFVPITVGGGIRTLEDIQNALNSGADKVAINTRAINNPEFLKEASTTFGSQCIVSSIVAKQKSSGTWEAYVDNGRESTGVDVLEWASKVEELGAGEIMLTSVDMEGTKKGFDLNLNDKLSQRVKIPVISSGGCGGVQDIIDNLENTSVDAIALASVLHYKLETVNSIKQSLSEFGINVRL